MHWRVAEAKQRFSELLRAASKQPQLIFSRNQLVAAVVEAKTFQEFQAWRKQQQKTSLADAFAELRRVCAEEGYTLEAVPRLDRPNAFADAVDDVSL